VSAAEERRRRHREPNVAETAQRRKVTVTELEHALWRSEILEAVLAQIS